MTTAQILEGALQALRTRGWHQGGYEQDGRMCLLAAFHAQGSEGDEYFAAQDALRGLIGGGIVVWQDTPGRTFAEVEALLTAAIAIASEQGSGCPIDAVLA